MLFQFYTHYTLLCFIRLIFQPCALFNPSFTFLTKKRVAYLSQAFMGKSGANENYLNLASKI